jgi:Spy/CpxP family protein refolding chaperone
MRRWTKYAVVCAAFLIAASTAVAGQPPQPFAWWKAEPVQKTLGLSADQVSRIEAVFQSTLPQLRKGKEELDRQEEELSRLISLGTDEAQVTRQVDRVEAIRADLNKARTLMLFRMRQVLTAEQRVGLKAMRDQAERDRRAGPPRDHQKP